MELFLQIMMCFGLSLLGGFTYTVITVWGKIKEDRRFSLKKFFGENVNFWIINVLAAMCLSLLLNLVPEMKSVIEMMGFVVETGKTGFVIIGIMLAGGTNSVPQVKSVQSKINEK